MRPPPGRSHHDVAAGDDDAQDSDRRVAPPTTPRWPAPLLRAVGARRWPDPARPARSDTVQATVWAPTCAEAEVLATWALFRGPDAAGQLPCAIVVSSGDVIVSFDQEAAS